MVLIDLKTGQLVKMAYEKNSSFQQIYKFQSPTSIVLYGPPQSGKTTLTQTILQNAQVMFTKPVKFIVYCYNKELQSLDELQRKCSVPILTHKGLPTKGDIEQWTTGNHFIIVLDDLQQLGERSRDTAEMFSVGNHHQNYTVIFLCHNLFSRAPYAQAINQNCHYMILFKTFRATLQISILGGQMFDTSKEIFPRGNIKRLHQQPHGYLLVNNHPNLEDEELRLVSNITPEKITSVYLPEDRL